LRQLASEFSELHHGDLRLPLAERFGTSLLLAVRPWLPDAFRQFSKDPAARGF
jgi:hypothetical protein